MRVRSRIWSLCSPRGRPSWRNGAVAAEGQEGTRDFRPPCAARRLATLSEAGGAGQYAFPAPQRLAVTISGVIIIAMRVVVAMSGGVDSSVAAALLAEAGHDVVGVSMQLYDQRNGESFGTCCTLDDLHDARRVAAALGVPHYILNFERQFEQAVVSNFVQEYTAGRTPLPCAHCNSDLKFSTLLERATGLGAAQVATGHYARVDRAADGRWLLRRGADRGEGSVLFPLLADAGAAGAGVVSRRAPDQGRGPRSRAAPGPGRGRQARQPGDLLRAERRLRGVRGGEGRRRHAPRPHRRRRREHARRARRRPPLHRRPAQGTGRGLAGAALRAADRGGERAR